MRHFFTVLGSLGLVVLLLRLHWKAGRALMVSAAALTLVLPARPAALWEFLRRDWANHPWATAFPVQTADLVVLVVLVNFVGLAMRELGLSARLTEGLRTLLRSRRLAMAGVPAVMGLLPTPGGIMLSAPMVRDSAEAYGVAPGRAALVNYWFRHVWEYVFPLFPAVPMVAGFLSIPVLELVKRNIAMSLVSLLLGALFLLRGFPAAPAGAPTGRTRRGPALAGVLGALWPIAMALALCVGLGVPPGTALVAAAALLVLAHRVALEKVREMFRRSLELDLALVIVAAMGYRAILESAGAVGNIANFVKVLGLPEVALVYALPFVVGAATGITSATMALTFPLLLGIIAPPGHEPDMRLTALAFCGGLSGIFLTPVHICLTLSREYFRTTFAELYKPLVPLVLAVSAAAFAFAIWGW